MLFKDCSAGCPHCESERKQFIANYRTYCSMNYNPRLRNYSKPLCDCIPTELGKK